MPNRLQATRVAAPIERGFHIKGKAHGQESAVRGYQLGRIHKGQCMRHPRLTVKVNVSCGETNPCLGGAYIDFYVCGTPTPATGRGQVGDFTTARAAYIHDNVCATLEFIEQW
jgi:hypothetical protein